MGAELFMRNTNRSAFTIVELIVVISVIAILAAISLVSYGAWRNSTTTASIKSDLSQAAATMESSRSFDNGYPLTLPSSFTASSGNIIALTVPNAKAYCIDGSSISNASILFYIDNSIQNTGPLTGTCATRTTLPVPTVVTNVAFTTSSSQITVTWTLPSPNYATQHSVQCARDPGFVSGIIAGTVAGATSVTTTLTGAQALSTYYCRVMGVNNNGQSAWSGTTGGDTLPTTCADSNQYGTYPDCYDYDSLPVGTSIAGYWTTPPAGYILEDGLAVSRTTYADLFALIGTGYGTGDGTTTFNVPDSRGRATVNINSADTEFDTVGEKYGEAAHIITLAELPSHSHMQYITANTGGFAVRTDYSADSTGGTYSQGINTGSAGGGAASNVTQPSIVKQYAIKWRPSTGTNSTIAPGTTLQGYWATPPTDYLAENGAAISRTIYNSLFSAVSTQYGAGDGSTTFNIPNSQGRLGVNLNSADTQFDVRGELFGSKTTLLSAAQMALHTHDQYVSAGTGGSAVRNDYAADAAGGTYAQNLLTGGAGSGQSFNIIQPSITKRSTLKTSASTGSQTDAGMKVGTSIEGWWSTAPSGYLLEDGSAVSRTTYSSLFALIGTTYGAGDGSTTFNLPNSRGTASVNKGSAPFATIGLKTGEKSHIMTLAELPAHQHAQNVSALSGGSAVRNDYKADAAGGSYFQGQGTGSNGSNSSYNVIQPSITKLFAIKF
jgi:prepilin-type N-terminal cleavage/methylation domain-containing protein